MYTYHYTTGKIEVRWVGSDDCILEWHVHAGERWHTDDELLRTRAKTLINNFLAEMSAGLED